MIVLVIGREGLVLDYLASPVMEVILTLLVEIDLISHELVQMPDLRLGLDDR